MLSSSLTLLSSLSLFEKYSLKYLTIHVLLVLAVFCSLLDYRHLCDNLHSGIVPDHISPNITANPTGPKVRGFNPVFAGSLQVVTHRPKLLSEKVVRGHNYFDASIVQAMN